MHTHHFTCVWMYTQDRFIKIAVKGYLHSSHFGELFQNAPHKTCTNPALTICKSENFRSEIRYERWKHYVKLDCYPLGYSFIIPKESKAPQRKTVQTQLVWTFTWTESRNLIPFWATEISAPKSIRSSASKSCERQQKRNREMRTPGTSKKILRNLPRSVQLLETASSFHLTVSECRSRGEPPSGDDRPDCDAENAEVHGRRTQRIVTTAMVGPKRPLWTMEVKKLEASVGFLDVRGLLNTCQVKHALQSAP